MGAYKRAEFWGKEPSSREKSRVLGKRAEFWGKEPSSGPATSLGLAMRYLIHTLPLPTTSHMSPLFPNTTYHMATCTTCTSHVWEDAHHMCGRMHTHGTTCTSHVWEDAHMGLHVHHMCTHMGLHAHHMCGRIDSIGSIGWWLHFNVTTCKKTLVKYLYPCPNKTGNSFNMSLPP